MAWRATSLEKGWLSDLLDVMFALLWVATAVPKTGARGPYSAEDLAVMESTTTTVAKEKMGL